MLCMYSNALLIPIRNYSHHLNSSFTFGVLEKQLLDVISGWTYLFVLLQFEVVGIEKKGKKSGG